MSQTSRELSAYTGGTQVHVQVQVQANEAYNVEMPSGYIPQIVRKFFCNWSLRLEPVTTHAGCWSLVSVL